MVAHIEVENGHLVAATENDVVLILVQHTGRGLVVRQEPPVFDLTQVQATLIVLARKQTGRKWVNDFNEAIWYRMERTLKRAMRAARIQTHTHAHFA